MILKIKNLIVIGLLSLFFTQCKLNRSINDAPTFDIRIAKIENKQNIFPERVSVQAKVIGIKDGDTMEVLYENTPITIRLEHIDSPEKRKKQPFSNEAKKALSDLCFAKEIMVNTQNKRDRYNRLLAVIYTMDGLNINKEMVRQGYAWHFVTYSTDLSYDSLQNEAMRNKVGLWAEEAPVQPWMFRSNKNL